MIFVTTGTHEQQFDRLVQAIDHIALTSQEEIFVQYGYHTKPPVHARGEKLVDRDKMERLIKESRIVVTHGGPGSIWACFDRNKIPIVVPRQHKFGEPVNDHQVLFCRRLASSKRVVLVEDIRTLEDAIRHYDQRVAECCKPGGFSQPARTAFCQKLTVLLDNS